jgi:hypothetical protein
MYLMATFFAGIDCNRNTMKNMTNIIVTLTFHAPPFTISLIEDDSIRVEYLSYE